MYALDRGSPMGYKGYPKAQRFEGAPLQLDPEHEDMGWTIAEPIAFDPWLDGEPGWLGKLYGRIVGPPYFFIKRWKSDHDRCWHWLCFRRRYRAPGAKGSHGACRRHILRDYGWNKEQGAKLYP